MAGRIVSREHHEKATPRPWRIKQQTGGLGIYAEDEIYPIATVHKRVRYIKGEGQRETFPVEANARLIIESANAHDANRGLLEAAKRHLRRLEVFSLKYDVSEGGAKIDYEWLKQPLLEAIAKVEAS